VTQACPLQGRRVVVTGAAGALGSVVCRVLTQAGAGVLAVGRPQAAERLAALAQELSCRTAMLDVGSSQAWAELAGRGQIGDVQGAVLIAGGWAGGANFHVSGPAQLSDMLSLNLLSAGASLQALLGPMVARGSGSVVVIGSKNAALPELGAGSAAYTASKAGLVALAQAIAAEVRPRGVRVNALLPSTIDTPANRSAMPQADFTRWVTPGSLAQAALYLLSDVSSDISGAALPVYGRS